MSTKTIQDTINEQLSSKTLREIYNDMVESTGPVKNILTKYLDATGLTKPIGHVEKAMRMYEENKPCDQNEKLFYGYKVQKTFITIDELRIYTGKMLQIKEIKEVKEVKEKRKNLPTALRAQVWNKYVGESTGKIKCFICGENEITQMTFVAGHVKAQCKGGPDSIYNLRPICQSCNSSMSSKSMGEYIDLITNF